MSETKYLLEMRNNEGDSLFRMNLDGSTELSEGAKLDEVAKIFVENIGINGKTLVSSLQEAVRHLTNVIAICGLININPENKDYIKAKQFLDVVTGRDNE